MKYKYEIIALIVSWVGFVVWEFYVQQWIENQSHEGGAIIRVDLIIILPALTMLTLWTLFRMKTER